MADPLGTAIAFAALGANVLATGLLLLFNPRSRAVRWYTAFLTDISVWLLALGVLSITDAWAGPWATVYAGAVFALPGLFLAATLAQVADDRTVARWAVVGLTVPAIPLGVAVMTSPEPTAVTLAGLGWHVFGWGAGSYLQWRTDRDRPRAPAPAGVRRLTATLLTIPGIVVVGAVVLGARAFFSYVMPLLVVAIHFIIFVGVVWLRYYDIEVRATRSGDTAGRALEAERLAAVGELAASVAHEVRNPLTGVRSLAQRMAEEEVDPERWRRYSGVIMEEVGRVDRIVGNLLDVARRTPEATVEGEGPTELAPLFDDLILLTAARADRAGVSLEADARGLTTPAPREPLAQVLLNLVLNGVRHTPEGGRVRLMAEESGGGITLRVRDGGPGVPPEERERIFEPFHTMGAEGSGLGLSVVRRIAGERDWTVEVGDAPGGGAEFRVALPGKRAGGGGSP